MSLDLEKENILSTLAQVGADGLKVGGVLDGMGLTRLEQARIRRRLETMIKKGLVAKVARGTYALSPGGLKAYAQLKPASIAVQESAAPTEKRRKQRRVRSQNSSAKPSEIARRAGADNTGREEPEPQCQGRIRVHPAGYGFVVREDGHEDVFVPAKYRGAALDGDKVLLYTWRGYKGTEGRVEKVLARGRAKLTGVLERSGGSLFLIPDDPRIATDFGRVEIVDGPGDARIGDCVVVDITQYPNAVDKRLSAKIGKVLGAPEDPRTEIQKIIICADIPYEMPEEALAQAELVSDTLSAEDFVDRIDLRDRDFVTIDPETARDFDDAICIEDGPLGGPRVWVAVADVSHYVKAGDALDSEAQIRGVSVYLPDQVIPMLPMKLSAGICSLNPHVDRCAMVVRMDYDAKFNLRDTGFAAAVICSSDRLDYPGVAAALDGDFRGRRAGYRKWESNLHRLNDLAQHLRSCRGEKGTLELDIPEAKVILDADDPLLIRDVVRSKGNDGVKLAYQLVEEFMVSANEAVGEFFRSRNLDTVWRIHAPPKEERVEELAEILGAFGVHVNVQEAITPIGMRKVLQEVNALPSGQALSFLVLRSLTQAIYDTGNVGHFGLASTEYIHFTSPIRRYPDLLVHRLMKTQLAKEGQAAGGGGRLKRLDRAALQELAAACSGYERRAVEAEREAVSMYRAYLMRDQVGEEFHGKISGVAHFGAFVEIEQPFVEGLIKVDAIGEDQFDFDPVMMELSGRRTGFTLALGDEVDVTILNVSVGLRRIELGLSTSLPAPLEGDDSVPRAKEKRRVRRVSSKGKGERSGSGKGDRTVRKSSRPKATGSVNHRGPGSAGSKKKKTKVKGDAKRVSSGNSKPNKKKRR